jgi:CRP-like cAMP-binding protein
MPPRLAYAQDPDSDARSPYERLVTVTRLYCAGQEIVRAGRRASRCRVLLDGLASRQILTASARRQITRINVPGEVLNLESIFLRRAGPSTVALTDCKVGEIPQARLTESWGNGGPGAQLVCRTLAADLEFAEQQLVCMGQLPSLARFAHLLCDLARRMAAAGLGDGRRYLFPITQAALADTLGVSSVHLNRTMQELRRRRLVSFLGGCLTIHDRERLAHLAQFDTEQLGRRQ